MRPTRTLRACPRPVVRILNRVGVGAVDRGRLDRASRRGAPRSVPHPGRAGRCNIGRRRLRKFRRDAGRARPRARQRIAAFKAGTRPGQRRPIVYCSRVNTHAVANALIAGGIAGVASGFGGLGVADWNNDLNAARDEVAGGSGPFPIVWRQYANMGAFDAGVASVPWLTTVSSTPEPAPRKPPKPAGDGAINANRYSTGRTRE